MPLGAGLAKLVVVGLLTISGGQAIYSTLKPAVTPEQRIAQTIQHHGDVSELTEEERRRALKRGLIAEGRRRGGTTTEIVPPAKPSLLSRLVGKIPKPRVRIRLR